MFVFTNYMMKGRNLVAEMFDVGVWSTSIGKWILQHCDDKAEEAFL